MISGQGSNLRALLQSPQLVKIKLVLSSSAAAPGLLFARRYGIKTLVLEKPINWSAVEDVLRGHGIDAIFLLGFMRLIPESFVNSWAGRILNLHPSLLPKFPGLKSIEAAFTAHEDIGVTVHEVTAEMDAGPQVMQRIAVDKTRGARLTLKDVEFLTHVCEQQTVRESIRKWTSVRM